MASKDAVESKKLIRDDEVEFDPQTGLITILGGKWTTHRLMGEETIDKVQEYLEGAGYAVVNARTSSRRHSWRRFLQRTAKPSFLEAGREAGDTLDPAVGRSRRVMICTDPGSWIQMDEVLQLARWALCKPDGPALLAPGQEALTYGALLPLIHRTRDAFRAAGLRSKEPAGVLMQPGLSSILACLAVAGETACTPLDPSLTADEYVSYLKRLRASTVVVQDDGESQALAAARELGLLVLRASLGDDGGANQLAVETVLPRTSSGTERRTDASLLFLTSSTTGDPKLVPVSAGNLTARFDCDGRALGLGPADRHLAVMPLFHVFGLLSALTQLRYGGSVVCAPGFDPLRFASWWDEFRPTWFAAGIPVLHAIAGSAPAEREIFASAPPRCILVGTGTPEPALRETVEQIMRAPVLVGYGSSESGPATRNRIGAAKHGSVGTSIGSEISVADPFGNLLPPHQEGEVLLRGPGVVSHYLDDDEADLRAFRNGWFRTGDLGYLDHDGFLFLTGRLKEIISRGSEKIRPGEIDHALASHPGVEDAASFAIPHRTLGEDVAAAVVAREGAQLTETDLRRYASARLATFKIPRLFVFVDTIPRTASGKPKRALLASCHGPAVRRESSIVAPRTDAEQRIVRIWTHTLGKENISVYDDFMQLGGDSLSSARMLAEVDGEFHTNGRVMVRSDFFDAPTVSEFARIVTECQTPPEAGERTTQGILAFHQTGAPPEGTRKVSDATPLFCFPGWRGRDGGPVEPYQLYHLARSLGARQPFHVVTASILRENETPRPVEELARMSVQAIRGMRPYGPYFLAGHCLGAVVAFEAAQQLLAAGETVPRLLLFDAEMPGYPKMAGNWSKYWAEVSRIVRHFDWREARSHADSLVQLLKQRVTGRFRRRAARFQLGNSVNVNMLNNRRAIALWQYTPRDCAVPMVHFMAADHPVSKVLDDPRYGWRDVARGGIEFQSVSGDHESMFSPENAPQLAERIRTSLRGLVLGASVR